MNRRNFLKVTGAAVGVAALGVPATDAVAVDDDDVLVIEQAHHTVPDMTTHYEQCFGDHWHYIRIGTIYNWTYQRDGLYASGTGWVLPDFDSPRDVRALASVIVERGI